MHTNLTGHSARPADQEHLPNLKQAGLPPRPRAVLEAVLDAASTALEAGLTATLNDLEQQLFKLAEQAKSNDAQSKCFESLREIRRGRSDVTPRFLIRLEAALASIEKDPQAPNFARITRGQREEFELVDDVEFEQSLVLQEVASKAEIRNSQTLFALGQRFGVLAGSAAIEADELPVGPHRLCECLRGAAACLDVQLEHRVLLYRVFDRTCMTQLGALYDKLNDVCIEQRVLPNLQLTHTRKRNDQGGPRPVAPAAGNQPAPTARGGAAPAGDAGGARGGSAGSQGTAPAGVHAGGAHAGSGHAGGGHAGGGHAGGGHAGGGHAGGGHAGGGHAGGGHAGGGHAGGGEAGGGHAGAAGAGHAGGAAGGGGFGGGAVGAAGHGGAAATGQAGHAGPVGRGGAGAGSHADAGGHPAAGGHGAGHGAAHGGAHGGAAHGAARGEGPAARHGAPPDDANELPALRAFGNPMTGWPGHAPPPVERQQPDARELELFDTMRDLLAGRRHALGLPQPATEGSHQVRGEDVQSVLASLQTKPTPTMMMGGKLVSRSVSHLKQDVLSQLRQVTPDGKAPRLSEMDADTIDLVGMLFEHLSKDVKPDSQVQQLMTRLQIPLLRVALKDKSFFTRRSHPARQLLNSVAESGLFWLDDESDDRALVEKMRVVVDRVSAEYDDKLDVFEDLLGDLSKHLTTITRKSEVAERRHVDAAKGRERLEQARSTASRAVAERIGKSNPPALIKTLLEQAWTDVLALTLLRQGETSEAYRKRLAVADQLLETNTESLGAVPDDARHRALRQEVEAGLSQVGYHGEDVQAVVRRLFGGPSAAANDDPASLTELAIKLKARSRLGGDADGDRDAKAKPLVASSPLSPDEQRVLERLRTIPYGTWFEFTINQQGDKARRKLSWFSTLTGRCLFVNQRGVRVEERTLDALAREVVRGTARVVEAQKESLIDRAWNAIVASLRQFGGKPATAAAATGVVKP